MPRFQGRCNIDNGGVFLHSNPFGEGVGGKNLGTRPKEFITCGEIFPTISKDMHAFIFLQIEHS